MNSDLLPAISRLGEILQKSKMGAIILPPDPSVDSTASATALYLALIKKELTLSLVCPGKIEADLIAIDKIQSSPEAPGDNLVITFPYSEGAIDKIDYFIENDKFNLIIAPRSSFKKLDYNQVKFSYSGGNFDFVIVLDTPTLNSLGELYQNNPNLFQGREIVNIDRHFTNTNFGTVNIIKKESPSMSELIYQIIKQIPLEIDKDIATNLYSGIATATNNFTSYSTNADTFQTIAELLRAGAIKKVLKKPASPSPFLKQQPPVMQKKETQRAIPIAEVEKEKQPDEKNAPSDWLKPKIFRGGDLI
jgi:nanoRNase/pAp phosphatase (c-di-AMP/oligoRNAs hydrolase)